MPPTASPVLNAMVLLYTVIMMVLMPPTGLVPDAARFDETVVFTRVAKSTAAPPASTPELPLMVLRVAVNWDADIPPLEPRLGAAAFPESVLSVITILFALNIPPRP